MGDTVITVVAIVLVAGLMLVSPLLTMSDKTENVSQLTVETATTEFVDDIRNTGELTWDKYSKFVENISATGNRYEVEMEFKILDENPGKKTTQVNPNKIGENVYYSVYTSQILDDLKSAPYKLKEGDIVSVSIKNTNPTMSEQLSGSNLSSTITAEHAGMVTKTNQ